MEIVSRVVLRYYMKLEYTEKEIECFCETLTNVTRIACETCIQIAEIEAKSDESRNEESLVLHPDRLSDVAKQVLITLLAPAKEEAKEEKPIVVVTAPKKKPAPERKNNFNEV